MDPRLSGDEKVACGSCHDVRTNGAGGYHSDFPSNRPKPKFATLSVFNSALNFRLNWEGKFHTLEEQARATFKNPAAMATNVDDVVTKLRADPAMVREFREAYGHEPDEASLLNAIATYERSLLTPGSRFDRWLSGDVTALTQQEQTGYGLFKSLGCVSCHQGVNVGGNLFERPGIFHPLATTQPGLLRVPSLRNVAAIGPYLHDGSAGTLADAVDKMAHAQLDRVLTQEQVEAIVAFLKTLTGNINGVPVSESPP